MEVEQACVRGMKTSGEAMDGGEGRGGGALGFQMTADNRQGALNRLKSSARTSPLDEVGPGED